MSEDAGEVICKDCGHEAKHHNATVTNRHGTFVIEGCCIIDLQTSGPFPIWTMESIEAGQHKPCRCEWDGKAPQCNLSAITD